MGKPAFVLTSNTSWVKPSGGSKGYYRELEASKIAASDYLTEAPPLALHKAASSASQPALHLGFACQMPKCKASNTKWPLCPVLQRTGNEAFSPDGGLRLQSLPAIAKSHLRAAHPEWLTQGVQAAAVRDAAADKFTV